MMFYRNLAIVFAGPLFFLAVLALWTTLDLGPRIDGRDEHTYRRTSYDATRGMSITEVERFREAIEVITHNRYVNDPSYGQDVYDHRARTVCHGRTIKEILAEAETYRKP